jgi:hypothetical protein
MKKCIDCGVKKPFDAFSPSKKNRDGRASYCRTCVNVRNVSYRDQRRGRPSARAAALAGQKWCPRCRTSKPIAQFGKNRSAADGLTSYCLPCHREVTRANTIKLHGSTREYHLRRRYGITSADFDALVAAQGGLCALCRERVPEHVDHDHVTGVVRGVLCSGCNQGLGNFRDSVAALRNAIDYLERTTWQRQRVSPGVFRLTSPRPAAAPSRSSSELQRLICSRRG